MGGNTAADKNTVQLGCPAVHCRVSGAQVVRSPPRTHQASSTALNGLLRGTSFRFTLYTLAQKRGPAECDFSLYAMVGFGLCVLYLFLPRRGRLSLLFSSCERADNTHYD